LAQLLALVAVCLCIFVSPVVADECPLLAGTVAGEPGEGIAVSGGYAYIGRSEYSTLGGGLDVYDVSDPTDPVLVGSLDAPLMAAGLPDWQRCRPRGSVFACVAPSRVHE